MLTPTAQIRISPETAVQLSILAGIWNVATREAVDRIVESYVNADPKLAELVKQASEAGKGAA